VKMHPTISFIELVEIGIEVSICDRLLTVHRIHVTYYICRVVDAWGEPPGQTIDLFDFSGMTFFSVRLVYVY
jgi:hypothetical protein